MSVFTFAISCLTMSSLPWFMDLTFQVPVQYYTALDFAFTTRHIHNWASFLLLSSHFIISGAISNCPQLFSGSTLGGYSQPGVFTCHIFLPFHTIHEVLTARILEWFAISSSRGTHFFRTLHYELASWATLHGLVHGFIELCSLLRHDSSWAPYWKIQA